VLTYLNNKSSAVAEMDGHNRYGPKSAGGADVPLSVEGAGSPSNTMSPGPRPTSVPSGILMHPAFWPQYTRAENWGCAIFLEGGPESPSNTMWPGPMPTSLPSGTLIHPTVWPQYTNVTERTDSQADNGPIA